MVKVTAIYHFPNSFFSEFFRFLSKDKWIDLRVLFCYPTTNSGILNKKTGKFSDWGVDLLNGYNYVFMEHKYKTGPGDILYLKNPEVKKLITRDNTDVVLLASSYWAPTTWMAIRQARKLGIPLITRATVEARRKRKWYIQIIRDLLVKYYCRQMKSGIYECEDQKQFLISHGMKEEDVFFAPCAVNNSFFQEARKHLNKKDERKALGIKDDNIVFLFLAGMNARKRPMDLLRAFENVHKQYDNISLIFVGDGEEKEVLSEYVEKNKIKDVFILGFANRENIIKYYSVADIYILPAENDASPKTLNEAMNFSLPIIITKGVGTSKYLLQEVRNGFIYDAGDVDKLTEILIWFLTHNEDITQMGELSLQIVSKYGLPSLCNGWKLAIDNALKKK